MEQRIQQAAPTTAIPPRGVGGWLLFFIISLLFITPAFQIYVFYNEWKLYRHVPSPLLLNFLLIDWSMRVFLICFAIYAGIQLVRLNPGAPRIAKRYLLAIVVQQGVLLLVGFWLIQRTNAGPDTIGDVIMEPLRSLIYVGIWYGYFVKSERVRATYGEQRVSDRNEVGVES